MTKHAKKQDKFFHTNPSPKGMGDFYNTGIKAKVGTMREGVGMVKATKKQVGTVPKTLA